MNQNNVFNILDLVYLDKINQETLEELDARIEETGGKLEFDASGQLAGRIKQTHLDDVISDNYREHILKHCRDFW